MLTHYPRTAEHYAFRSEGGYVYCPSCAGNPFCPALAAEGMTPVGNDDDCAEHYCFNCGEQLHADEPHWSNA